MDSDDPIQSCQLIGLVGILIQLVLAALSFSVLVYKRYKERPKRAWKIWFLDTSKQGASQFLAHVINVAISIHLSANIQSDACIWYLTTNVLDNTVGVFLCIGALSLVQERIFEPNYTNFKSGNYYTVLCEYEDQKSFGGNDIMIEGQNKIRAMEITRRKTKYAISYWNWLIQFVVWNVIVVISKTLLFYTELGLSTPIIEIALFLIGWIQPYQTLQLILVIIVVPVIMNGLAFWIQDNFLMQKNVTIITIAPQEPGSPNKKEMSSGISTGEEDIVKPQMAEPLL